MSIDTTTAIVHPLVAAAARLDDASLVARVEDLARSSRATTVELLAHLGELERRKLHRGRGCGKLFPYCTEILGFSEASAWNRIKAARAARRFPVVLDLLAAGRVNLTTVRLLAPHLTPENHAALLDEASGLPRRAVDRIVARLDPKPDVPSVVRKLPTGAEGAVGTIVPLRPSRYKLEVTVGDDEHDDLRWLQDALRREISNGDPAAIVGRALKALRAQVEKKVFAATDRPRSAAPVRPGSRSIPAAVQRHVWRRDRGRCAFVSRDGRRCSETSYLEYHHVEPYGIGGEATTSNIALRCRAHNAYEADLVFGEREVRRSGEDTANGGTRREGGAQATARL